MLLHNNGSAVFEDVADRAGPVFSTGYNARGLAIGDFDNDGDSDLVFTCLNDGPVLLRNDVGHDRPWVGFQLVGTKSNRDAVGAKLILRTSKRRLVRWITSGSSYLSSHDKRVTFGLGNDTGGVDLEIHWPSAYVQRISGLATRRYHTIREDTKASVGLF